MWQKIKQLWQSTPTTDTDSTSDEASTPVVLMVCSGPVEASMYVSQLIDAGIPATTVGADSASVFGLQSGLLADVRIVVPAEFADAARELLELDDMTAQDDEWIDDHTSDDSPALDGQKPS
ncbi:MAG: putative signal transducing protein [Roseiflexaceae bacterium]